MKHSDFYIGLHFFNVTGEWLCTDVGSRTIAAIRTEDRLPSAWYAGPPYAVSEKLFNELGMKRCFTNIADELEERLEEISEFSYDTPDVLRMLDGLIAVDSRKPKYPLERHAVFEIDRVSPVGELLHPFSVKRRKGHWAIQYFEPFTKQYGEMPENDFVALSPAPQGALQARAKGNAND